VLPAQVEVSQIADNLSTPSSSAYLLLEPRPWISGDMANPRRAAVIGSNFDAVNPIGGTSEKGGRSAAIVLEEEPEDRQ
jgi:hypothetical protein